MKSMDIDQLRSILTYDPLSGNFSWIKPTGRRVRPGGVAGFLQNGYVNIQIEGTRYFAHRLAWAYMTGKWPAEIDHKDGNKSNNAWENLRDVCRSANVENLRRPRKDNACGLLGVCWHKREGKFRAQIQVAGKKIQLGTFKDAQHAHAAYLEAKRRLHAGNTL